MTTKIVLLNGAPSSGKDTLANYLRNSDEFLHWKYANKVRENAQLFYPQINWWDDCIKDTHLDALKGRTPRQILIKIGLMARTEIDVNIWVDALANEIEEYQAGLGIDNTFVISDCGFQNEVDVMVDRFGIENVLLVRIYREGYTFENDSRNYVTIQGDWWETHNNNDINSFLDESADFVNSWLADVVSP